MHEIRTFTRRGLLATACAAVLAQGTDPLIDIHQHTNYAGRTDEEVIAHQKRMGATKTVLLPAGSKYGLAAQAGGNETVVALAKAYPNEFVFFANELPDIPGPSSTMANGPSWALRRARRAGEARISR